MAELGVRSLSSILVFLRRRPRFQCAVLSFGIPGIVLVAQDRRTDFDFFALIANEPNDIGAADANVLCLAQLKKLTKMTAGHCLVLEVQKRSFDSNACNCRARMSCEHVHSCDTCGEQDPGTPLEIPVSQLREASESASVQPLVDRR